MGSATRRTASSRGRLLRATAVAATLALVASACGGDDDASPAPAPETTAGGGETTEPEPPEETTAPAPTTEPSGTDPEPEPEPTTPPTGETDQYTVFPELGPPTGDPIVIGLVNTEGTPGLDFPDIRLAVDGAVAYLNQHGGVGNRPIVMEHCTAAGSPETSQACAQELTGKNVELVLLGLDLFPDYATYTAAGIPVIGMLPILPGDYTANALFLTGGNATTFGAAARVALEHFGAKTAGIVSADNPGANASLATLTASLDKAGIEWNAVKGGDNETDAGYQGLMRAAAAGNPDVLFSLYSDAGCIGTIRGRAALGIDIPVITTGICSGAEVLEQVGDDAIGWTFIGVATQEDTPALAILQEIMAPVLGIPADDVDSTALGLGGLGLLMAMSVAVFGNELADQGSDVTGQAIYDHLLASDNLALWPGETPIDCGAAPAYPTICAFTFPFADYQPGGGVLTIPGLEAVSSLDFLP